MNDKLNLQKFRQKSKNSNRLSKALQFLETRISSFFQIFDVGNFYYSKPYLFFLMLVIEYIIIIQFFFTDTLIEFWHASDYMEYLIHFMEPFEFDFYTENYISEDFYFIVLFIIYLINILLILMIVVVAASRNNRNLFVKSLESILKVALPPFYLYFSMFFLNVFTSPVFLLDEVCRFGRRKPENSLCL
jgi:hypothetical protein